VLRAGASSESWRRAYSGCTGPVPANKSSARAGRCSRTRSRAPSGAAGTTASDEAGEHLAGLYSLIATCEVNGVNPVAYLAEVLICLQAHPASRTDELLPHNWAPPRPEPPA
jgi:hypothetical protein